MSKSSIVLLTLFIASIFLLLTHSQEYVESLHPCDRACTPHELYKICKYDFVVTMTTSMAFDAPPIEEEGKDEETTNPCGKCPTKLSDCYNPSCITGDGLKERPVLVVNGMFPGPIIRVCEGDQVIINVTNNLINVEAIALHWHGIHQRGTPYMDGASMITQCPINFGTTFRYSWMASPAGTTFWHAHTALHRTDGLVGPLIVRHRVQQQQTIKQTDTLRYQNYKLGRSKRRSQNDTKSHTQFYPASYESKKDQTQFQAVVTQTHQTTKDSFYIKFKSSDDQHIKNSTKIHTEITPNYGKRKENVKRKQVLSNRIVKDESLGSPTSYLDIYDFSNDINLDRGNVLMVQEWKHGLGPFDYLKNDEEALAILVNGRQGIRPGSPPTILFLKKVIGHDGPLIRIISNGFLFCPIQARIDGFRMKVIALDGNVLSHDMSKSQGKSGPRDNIVDVLTIFPGERIDIILVKKELGNRNAQFTDVDDDVDYGTAETIASEPQLKLTVDGVDGDIYAMQWRAVGVCHNEHFTANATVYLVIREVESNLQHKNDVKVDDSKNKARDLIGKAVLQPAEDIILPQTIISNTTIELDKWHGQIFNPVHEVDFNLNENYLKVNDLKSNPNLNKEYMDKIRRKTDYKIFIFTDSYLLGEDIPMFNNISFMQPSAPLLSQFKDVPNKELCNFNTRPECSREFCACTHIYEIELGSLVEIILIDEGLNDEYDIHSIHLHGHSFAVLAQEKLNKTLQLSEVIKLDKEGKLIRNLDDLIIKDVAAIPEGGYTIIRFFADNPGFWMLHCHLDYHFLKGMALVFKVGDVESDMPAVPNGFPKCGSWFNTNDRNIKKDRWRIFKP